MTKQLVEIAAQIYSCKVEELLSYREYEDGSVVIIAPTGQKFTYSAEQIMKRILENAEESSKATVPIAVPFEKGGEEMVSEVGQAPAGPVTKVVTPSGPAAAPEDTVAPLTTEPAMVTVETPSAEQPLAALISGPQGRGVAPDPGGAGVTKTEPAKKKRPAKGR